MWGGRTVSVAPMTYAKRDSIRGVIDGFFATGVDDEDLVVNNNAEPGTAEEVAKTRARQVFETRQGYGCATRRGLAEAKGELIVLCEPDGTFLPGDVVKLLAYGDECDAVSRNPHDARADLARRQHGAVAEVGKPGRRQDGRGPFQHESPQ